MSREPFGRPAAILIAIAVAACAGGDAVYATTGSGGAGGAGGGAGGAGGAPTGDPLPQGTVSFFRTEACPTGWSPYEAAAGRFIVPTVGNAVSGIAHGQPLESGEDRAHLHDVAGTFTLPATSYVGAPGGGNHGVAAAGVASFSTTTEPASLGIPFVQLRACKKLAPAVARATPLPARLQIFIDAPACPDGWKQVELTQGRFLVGRPSGAPADQTFGGAPLSGNAPASHAHESAPELVTKPHGIALASGCCGDGYAKDGTYATATTTTVSEAGLPYVPLLACEKK